MAIRSLGRVVDRLAVHAADIMSTGLMDAGKVRSQNGCTVVVSATNRFVLTARDILHEFDEIPKTPR